jgi:anaerobic selenocysteine-containing dehydrogenase
MLALADPHLRAAWVERGNPIPQNPDTNTVLRAFRSLEFRVVVDQFLTDTAREADIVLPAKTMFEQSDVIGAYWHPYLQLKQKVLEPPGEVKPETEIYCLLAARLGLDRNQIAAGIPGPTDAEVDAFLVEKLQPFPDLTLDRLREGPLLAPGQQEVAFSDLDFPTSSGKIELLSRDAENRWGVEPLPVFNESHESIRNASAPHERYPLYLLTPNTKNRIHSQFNNLEMIRQLSRKPVVVLPPEDAASRRIRRGDLVRVFNDRGQFELEARIDFGLKAGCAVVTNGWWLSEGGAVNLCSLGRETDLGYGAAFHDNLVQVVKVDQTE